MHGSSVASFPGEGFAPTGVIASPFGSGLLSDRCNGIGGVRFFEDGDTMHAFGFSALRPLGSDGGCRW